MDKLIKRWTMALVLFCGAALGGSWLTTADANSALRLSISFPKSTYTLGEPIRPTFQLTNMTSKAISIADKFGVETGTLQVVATKDGSNFLGFGNPKWGLLDCVCKTVILPDETKQAEAGILWYADSRGNPDFRLKESGTYEFKIRYKAHLVGSETVVNLESDPVRINVRDPEGENMLVWNILKSNGQFAYFMQEDEFSLPEIKLDDRSRFQTKIDQIIRDFPNSQYSEYLRRSLDGLRSKNELRKSLTKDWPKLQVEKKENLSKP